MYRIGETIPLTYAVWDSTNNLLLTGQSADLKLDIVDENDTTIQSYFLAAADISEYPGPSGVYYVNANVFDAAGLYKAIWNCQITGAEGFAVDLIKVHSRDIDNVDDRLANDSTGLNKVRLAAATDTSIQPILDRLDDDSTGLHALKTFVRAVQKATYNKFTVTRNSSTSYTLRIYDDAGSVVEKTISISKAGDVETHGAAT